MLRDIGFGGEDAYSEVIKRRTCVKGANKFGTVTRHISFVSRARRVVKGKGITLTGAAVKVAPPLKKKIQILYGGRCSTKNFTKTTS